MILASESKLKAAGGPAGGTTASLLPRAGPEEKTQEALLHETLLTWNERSMIWGCRGPGQRVSLIPKVPSCHVTPFCVAGQPAFHLH